MRDRNEANLFAFLTENKDDIDEQAFQCQAHFYAGYLALMNKQNGLAAAHFSDSAAARRRQDPEYWIAKRKLAELGSADQHARHGPEQN